MYVDHRYVISPRLAVRSVFRLGRVMTTSRGVIRTGPSSGGSATPPCSPRLSVSPHSRIQCGQQQTSREITTTVRIASFSKK